MTVYRKRAARGHNGDMLANTVRTPRGSVQCAQEFIHRLRYKTTSAGLDGEEKRLPGCRLIGIDVSAELQVSCLLA
jgi:hypothetical protein